MQGAVCRMPLHWFLAHRLTSAVHEWSCPDMILSGRVVVRRFVAPGMLLGHRHAMPVYQRHVYTAAVGWATVKAAAHHRLVQAGARVQASHCPACMHASTAVRVHHCTSKDDLPLVGGHARAAPEACKHQQLVPLTASEAHAPSCLLVLAGCDMLVAWCCGWAVSHGGAAAQDSWCRAANLALYVCSAGGWCLYDLGITGRRVVAAYAERLLPA